VTVALADGKVQLRGDCLVEDAEMLLQLLQENPAGAIDIKDCGRLHMAVVQVMLAARRPVLGVPGKVFVREWLLPQMLTTAD
jgi:ribosome maturation factor RimP